MTSLAAMFGPLTMEGLVLGLACGAIVPLLASVVLQPWLGRSWVLAVTSLIVTALAVSALGNAQGHPSALQGAFVVAPGVQAIAFAFLWRDRLWVMLGLFALGLACLVPSARLLGLW